MFHADNKSNQGRVILFFFCNLFKYSVIFITTVSISGSVKREGIMRSSLHHISRFLAA
jgi:hypothetical protein